MERHHKSSGEQNKNIFMVHLKKKQDVFYLLLKQYNLKDVVFFKNEND